MFLTMSKTVTTQDSSNKFGSPFAVLVFATMTAEFRNETGLDFKPLQELALRHKAGRTERWAAGHSRHAWGYLGFCRNQTQDFTGDSIFVLKQV